MLWVFRYLNEHKIQFKLKKKKENKLKRTNNKKNNPFEKYLQKYLYYREKGYEIIVGIHLIEEK